MRFAALADDTEVWRCDFLADDLFAEELFAEEVFAKELFVKETTGAPQDGQMRATI